MTRGTGAWWPPVVRTEVGGIAVAFGELVGDATVDVENSYRRLRKNRARSMLKVVFAASSGFRNSLVYATRHVCPVVLPLFAQSGLKGRTSAPLGLADLVSLAVSLTVLPVLASFLLTGRIAAVKCDPLRPRGSKWRDAELLPTSAAWVQRAEWAVLQAGLDPRRLVFLDETFGTTMMTRPYGWEPKGERVIDRVPQGHGKTTTFVAAPRLGGLFAPWSWTGR